MRLWNPAVTPSLRFSPYFSAIPLLLADGIALKKCLDFLARQRGKGGKDALQNCAMLNQAAGSGAALHVALAIQQNLLLIFQLANFLHDLFLLVFF